MIGCSTFPLHGLLASTNSLLGTIPWTKPQTADFPRPQEVQPPDLSPFRGTKKNAGCFADVSRLLQPRWARWVLGCSVSHPKAPRPLEEWNTLSPTKKSYEETWPVASLWLKSPSFGWTPNQSMFTFAFFELLLGSFWQVDWVHADNSTIS